MFNIDDDDDERQRGTATRTVTLTAMLRSTSRWTSQREPPPRRCGPRRPGDPPRDHSWSGHQGSGVCADTARCLRRHLGCGGEVLHVPQRSALRAAPVRLSASEEFPAFSVRTTYVFRQEFRSWAEQGAARVGTGLCAYNVFAVSNADLARVRELQGQFFREMRSLVAASDPAASRTTFLRTLGDILPPVPRGRVDSSPNRSTANRARPA